MPKPPRPQRPSEAEPALTVTSRTNTAGRSSCIHDPSRPCPVSRRATLPSAEERCSPAVHQRPGADPRGCWHAPRLLCVPDSQAQAAPHQWPCPRGSARRPSLTATVRHHATHAPSAPSYRRHGGVWVWELGCGFDRPRKSGRTPCLLHTRARPMPWRCSLHQPRPQPGIHLHAPECKSCETYNPTFPLPPCCLPD
ncbi:hypothetical protein BDV95DRAFT_77095 [Massariosphaeria phaeospora]|uniref:Uncharacterized protein n=1 Tax=Massariosphaeria phaeospora TaxID=100035 RepID=A0A7C8M6U5_9PLEO|nr:hypothetical protein BDV95DRAFT_77095 [Massariosphaeria phaeospora]